MESTSARAQCFQLFAIGFAHPVAELLPHLSGGEYQSALAATSAAAVGQGLASAYCNDSFTDFEAEYIRLFQVGRRGRPTVSLNGADYDHLLEGAGRPEFLLGYAQWYSHFGLKIAEEDANELPDHLVCQLEFLSWLAHLEQRAHGDVKQVSAYQRAQRDFLARHLCRMAEALSVELLAVRGDSGALRFYLSLARALATFSELARADLERLNSDTQREDRVDVVNLWG